jgi:putative alpha-1,2-mannosidase
VRHATLDIGGNQLVISTVGSMDEGSRPVSFFFNGTELSKPEITWQELKNGGTLTFYMGM